MACETCNHEPHEPGECPWDNCGETGITRSPYEETWIPGEGPAYINDAGNMDCRDLPRRPPRPTLYTRAGKPRKVLY